MERMIVHSAPFDELPPKLAHDLWRLRSDVFIVEQACAYADLDGRDVEPATRHLWVDGDDGPIATARLLQDPDALRIGRLCVDASHRGTGVAAALMHAALELVGDGDSVLDAQAHLAHWYARFGFEQDGPEFVDVGIPHVPMRRVGAAPEPGGA